MTLFDENAEVFAYGGPWHRFDRGKACRLRSRLSRCRSASDFIEACNAAGFEARDTTDNEMECHDVTILKEMVPTCECITATERRSA
jgi:hypothetical protein